MENNLIKLTNIEAIFLILIIEINGIILNHPQSILSSVGSSSILNIIYISIIAFLFTLLILRLFNRFKNSDIIDVSEYLGGNFLKYLSGLLMVAYLIIISAASLRNFAEILYVTYYDHTHVFFIILFFILIGIIVNFIGESSIIKTNVIVTLIILISLFLTYIFSAGNFVIQRIFPLLGYGASSTFLSGLSNILTFNGIFALYFLSPMLSDKKSFKSISIISVIIISILLLLSTACLLLSVSGKINTDNISPLYTLISHNTLGKLFQHSESLFVFTWILSLISYLNIVVMLIIHFLKKITNIPNQNILILPVCIIIAIISLIPKNLMDTHQFELFIKSFIYFPISFVIFPLILILANIKLNKRKLNIKE